MSLTQKDKKQPEEELNILKENIYDYEISYESDTENGSSELTDDEVKASRILRGVLMALNLDYDRINIERIVTHTFEARREDVNVVVDFVGKVPEYWYAEADIQEKVVEVGIDDYRMRIPLSTILFWFSQEEKEDMR